MSIPFAFLGEFRRCYNNEELMNVLSWYEVLYGFGANLGPGVPVLLSFVRIEIGWWKIDKNNAVPVILAFLVSILFCFSWFYVIDLSKELDLIKLDFDERVPLQNNSHSEEKEKKSQEMRITLMKWTEFIQTDILLMAFSYAFIRANVIYCVGYVAMVTSNTFHWKMESHAWLNITLGVTSYLLTSMVVKLKLISGKRANFFAYIICLCAAMFVMALLMLPRAVDLTDIYTQVLFGGSVLFLKCFIYFQAQSSGKFLIYNTASYDNANSVDGLRAFLGNLFRMGAFLSLVFFYKRPELISPPFNLLLLIIIMMLLVRRQVHLKRS